MGKSPAFFNQNTTGMRKVILSMMVSLDGYIEDQNRQIGWHVWDDEMSRYMGLFFTRVDTLLLGRVTYQMMRDFWTTSAADKEDSAIADNMNRVNKIVFSKTLETVSWGKWDNARLIQGGIAKEVEELKGREGKDLVMFGGANLASAFVKRGLLDEYQLIVNPVVLGKGTPIFQEMKEILHMELIETRTFKCGNVLLSYKAV